MGKLPEMEAAMNAYFEDHVGDAGLGLEVLPGVVELLKALKVREGFDMHTSAPCGLCRIKNHWPGQRCRSCIVRNGSMAQHALCGAPPLARRLKRQVTKHVSANPWAD